MINFRPFDTVLMWIAVSAISTVAWSQDALEDALRQKYSLPLRWENIEAGPQWIGGKHPQRTRFNSAHAVHLNPGEFTCIRVPAYEWIRLVATEKSLSANDVEVSLSNGSGLLTSVEAATERNGESLFYDPRSPQPLLAYIYRPAQSRSSIDLSLYTSRHDSPGDLVRYRHLIPLSSERRVRLEFSKNIDSLEFWKWHRGDGIEMNLRGPARFKLETRYRYPQSDSGISRAFQIAVKDIENGNSEIAKMEFLSTLESSKLVFEDGVASLAGRLENGYFELPENRNYRVALESNAPVYLRLLQNEKSDFLFPLNQPGNADEILSSVPDTLKTAFQLARDNSVSEGGMMASALLWNAGWHRRDYPELRSRWRDFSTFTSFKDLIPISSNSDTTVAGFPTRTLRPQGREQDWNIISEYLVESATTRLQTSIFCPLPFGRNQVYLLPERHTAGRLRIIARRDRSTTAHFTLFVEGQKARQIRLLPNYDSDPTQYRPSISEAGLHFSRAGSLDRLRNPLETVSAGWYELMIPPEVRRLEIGGISDAGHLPVAVQFQSSKPFSLSEEQYLNLTENNLEIYHWLIDCVSRKDCIAQSLSGARAELYNHWEPLRRYIQSRCLQVSQSAFGPAMPDRSIEALDQLEADGEIFLADKLARNLYLKSSSPEVKKRAFGYLEELAIRKTDTDLIIQNAAVKLTENPDVDSALRLASLLRETGEIKLAQMLALAIPNREATREIRLATAFQRRWWIHFETAVAEAPGHPDCQVWYGIRLWHQGKYDAAVQQWEKAGSTGQKWIDHIAATENARAKVSRGEAAGISEWAVAEVNSPAKFVWTPVSHDRLESSPQARTLKAVENGRYIDAFVATPDAPVEYRFPTPGRYRIECRPLHPVNSYTPVEGWITLSNHQSAISKFPVLSNFPTPGLEVVGHSQETPGTKLYETVAFSGWNNLLKIRPDFGPALVRVSRWEPEVQVGHLPKLTEQTAAWLYNNFERPASQGNEEFGSVALIGKDHSVTWHKLRSPFAEPGKHAVAKMRKVFANCHPVPVSVDHIERKKSSERMRGWLSDVQSGENVRIAEAIAGASAEWTRLRIWPELKPLYSAILRQTWWEPLLATDQNAGFREVETEGWQPEKPSLLTRMRFLPQPGSTEQLITGNDSTVAMLTNREPNRITLHLGRDNIPFLPANPLHALVEVENKPPVRVELNSKYPTQTLHFDLPRGRTSIKVTITQNATNQYLRVGIDAEKSSETMARKTVRNWFVAYRDEPLTVRIEGPAWVRIDQLIDGAVDSRFHHVVANVETLSMQPEHGEALYRIHILRHDPAKRYLPPVHIKRSVNPLPVPDVTQSFQSAPVSVSLHDGLPLHGQEDGTWTAGLSYHNRRVIDEVDDRNSESFGQADLSYRYFDEDRRTWYQTSLSGRHRENGDATFGLERNVLYSPWNSPFTYSFKGSLFEQGGEWALSGKGKVSATGILAPKWKHTASAALFGRLLTMDEAGDSPDTIDRDIYSEYKSNHGIGLQLGDTISYTPWQDTRLYAGAGLSTNENIISPDYINYKLGIEQLIGNIRLDANLTGYRFFDDADRSDAVSRHRLNLEAVGEFWTSNRQRFEAGVRWSHYFEEDENSVSVFGRWHFGEGRRYRDFRPGEESFSNIRERQIPDDKNNSIHHHPNEKEGQQVR